MKKETLTVETDGWGTTNYCSEAYDKIHNPHGPALVWANGSKSYYINGKELTEIKFKAWQAQQTAK